MNFTICPMQFSQYITYTIIDGV